MSSRPSSRTDNLYQQEAHGLIVHLKYSFNQNKTFAQSYLYTCTIILIKQEKYIISFLRMKCSLFVRLEILYQRMLCVNFGWNSPVALEIKIFKFRQYIFLLQYILLFSPIEKKGVVLHLNKLESPSSKDVLFKFG